MNTEPQLFFEEERMSDEFTKFHVRNAPFYAVFHRFTAPDKGGPHDHPWGFTTKIIKGSYVERRYYLDGSTEIFHRKLNDSFEMDAKTIHRIVSLPDGECWTMITPFAWEREWGFWQFREDGAYFRQHDWPEFKKMNI